jgi:hypothetical protein
MSTAKPGRHLIAGICLLLPITALAAEADGAALPDYLQAQWD